MWQRPGSSHNNSGDTTGDTAKAGGVERRFPETSTVMTAIMTVDDC